MPNPVITNNDLGSVVFTQGEFRDQVYTASGTETLLEGTILARDSVSLKLVPFVVGGSTNENGIPKCVLINEFVSPGAGDQQIRPMMTGGLRTERLVIFADGDASNVDDLVLDQLRDFFLFATDVQELFIPDNQ